AYLAAELSIIILYVDRDRDIAQRLALSNSLIRPGDRISGGALLIGAALRHYADRRQQQRQKCGHCLSKLHVFVLLLLRNILYLSLVRTRAKESSIYTPKLVFGEVPEKGAVLASYL